tara:strand:+ start:346 stop:969 length:624 start_codon:yes stop_codon:yes gene_type:complete
MIDWSFENIICDALSIETNDLRSGKNPITGRGIRGSEEAAMGRYMCFMHLYNTSNLSNTKIGLRYFRDHATVYHGLKKYQEFIDCNDKKFNKALNYFNDRFVIVESKLKLDSLTDEQIQTIKFMKKEDVPFNRIASYYNISNEDLIKIVGPDVTYTLLHRRTKQAIVQRVGKGQSFVKISKDLNITAETVRRISNKYFNKKTNEKRS